MGMECLHCKCIFLNANVYGPTEMIENSSAISEKEKNGGGGGGGGRGGVAFKCLNGICLINEFG